MNLQKPRKEKVSIALPTYNRIPYLKEAIRSILQQTFQDFSLFVFDNASEEPVEEELKKMSDPRIHFVGNTRNIGVEGNMNRILCYPFESEYVTVFHDDDTMHPKMLEIQASFLDAHKDVAFVGSDFKAVSDARMQSFVRLDENAVSSIVYKDSYEFVRAEMSWLRCAFDSVLYRKEALEGVRMKPERFSDFADVALLFEVSRKGPTAFLGAPLINYRIHADQFSQLPKKEYEDGAIEMLSFCKESLPKPLSKSDEKLLRVYSVNFLLRSYAHINKGFFDFLRFLNTCRREQLFSYRFLFYLDAHGAASMASILFGNKKIIDVARWLKNSLPS